MAKSKKNKRKKTAPQSPPSSNNDPDLTTHPKNKKPLIYGIFLSVAATIVLLLIYLIKAKVLLFDDLGYYHLPLRSFYSDCLKSGESFIWNPYICCGVDLHGEGQLGMLHPLHLILYRLLPLHLAFNLEIILNLLLTFCGSFFLFKSLKFEKGVSLLAALTFSFCSFNILHTVHINMISVSAHLPWNLYFIHGLYQNYGTNAKKSALFAVAIAVSISSQLLMGYPQIIWICFLAELAFLIYLNIPNFSVKKLALVFWMKCVGIFMGAIQLLPTIESLSLSVRKEATEQFLNSFSLHPWNLLQFISPYFFSRRIFAGSYRGNPHENGLYCGALAFTALCYIFFNRKKLKEYSSLVNFSIILFVIGLLLSLGKYGLLYSLQIKIPFLDIFRVPSRYILLVHLSMTFFVAIMMQDILTAKENRPLSKKFYAIPILGILVFVFAAINSKVAVGNLDAGLANSSGFIFFGFALSIVSLFFVFLIKKNVTYILFLLAPFCLLDQGYYGLSYIDPLNRSDTVEDFSKHFIPPPNTGSRIDISFGHRNVFGMQGRSLMGGYLGLEPKNIISQHSPQRHQISGVEWSLQKPNDKVKVPHWKKAKLPALPRIHLINKTQKSSNYKKDIRNIDPMIIALTEEKLDLNDRATGTVSNQIFKPGFASFEVQQTGKQLVVFSERYHTSWKVTVDGKPEKITRVNGDFLGCVVDKGHHKISFKYSSDSLKKGIYASLIGLAFLCATWFTLQRKG